MKNYRKMVPIVLVFLMFVSIYSLFNSAKSKEERYYAILEDARNNASKGLLADAVYLYNEVLSMNETIDVYLEIGQMYKDQGTLDSQVSWGRYIVEKYPLSPESYEYLMQAYYDKKEYKSCFSLYETCKKRSSATDTVQKIYDSIKYSYEIDDRGYTDVRVYSGGYCAVLKNGMWGYVDELSKSVIQPSYLYAGDFMEVAPIVTDENEVYYIDAEGNKKYIPADDVSAVWLGLFDGSIYSLYDGTEYYYYSADNECLSGPYDYASTYNYNMAAVIKNDSWQFVGMTGEKSFEVEFRDVLLDAREIAFRNDRAFVSDKGSLYYKMIDLSGNQVGTLLYEDARVFLDFTYTAVKIDGKWGFTDKDGNLVIEPQYEDAASFCNGYAAVKLNGKWGYIDSDGKMIIKPYFDDAIPFNSRGCTFVKLNDSWSFIKMLKDNFE